MLNSRNKIAIYSFVFFILLLIIISFVIKNDTLLANSSRKEPAQSQTKTGGDKLPDEIAPQTGFLAPDFTFPDMDGKPVSLSDFKGKVVFLNIWATWCGPCRIEMPDMEKLYQKFKKKDFVILAVSIDLQGKVVVKPFIEELKLTFPILLSPDGSIQRTYMVNALPSSFIINKSGRIVARITGARDWFGSDTVETFEFLINET